MNHRTIRSTLIASSLVAVVLASGSAHAELQGRDLNGSIDSFEAYYDTDLDITWLADANYAQTSGADDDGIMTWGAATSWAANLSFFNPLTNQTYADWRLPTTTDPDASCDQLGYKCTGSEMGHLFYAELGGTTVQSILMSTDPDFAKFTNLQASVYWSATKPPDFFGVAWFFDFSDGRQGSTVTLYNDFYALAVSPGDVAAVPEAQTYALMLAGLGLIGWRARRRG